MGGTLTFGQRLKDGVAFSGLIFRIGFQLRESTTSGSSLFILVFLLPDIHFHLYYSVEHLYPRKLLTLQRQDSAVTRFTEFRHTESLAI